MDISLITAATASLRLATDIAKGVIGLRDFNQISSAVAQLNDQLLKAQNTLFDHINEMLALQQEHIKTVEELAKVKDALAEKERYVLFELATGFFVYRRKLPLEASDLSEGDAAEPPHYICQICFDRDSIRSVLTTRNGHCVCHACKRDVIYNPDDIPRSRA